MMTIGDPSWRDSPTHPRVEIRVFDSARQVLLIGGDVVSSYTARQSINGVPLYEFWLRRRLGILGAVQVNALIEIWVEPPEMPLTLLGRGRVDYVKEDEDKEGQPVFHCQARSPAAVLFDSACHTTFDGELPKFIDRLASDQGFEAKIDLPAKSVKVRLNAASTYGALRLLGLSCSFVIRPGQDGVMNFVDIDAAKRVAETKPMKTIHQNDVKNVRFEQGVPVKPPRR